MTVAKRLAGVLMGISFFLPCGSFFDVYYPYNSMRDIPYDLASILIAIALLLAYYWPIAVWYCDIKLSAKTKSRFITVAEPFLCLFSALFAFIELWLFNFARPQDSYGVYIFSVAILTYAFVSFYKLIISRRALITIGGT